MCFLQFSLSKLKWIPINLIFSWRKKIALSFTTENFWNEDLKFFHPPGSNYSPRNYRYAARFWRMKKFQIFVSKVLVKSNVYIKSPKVRCHNQVRRYTVSLSIYQVPRSRRLCPSNSSNRETKRKSWMHYWLLIILKAKSKQ